MYKRKLKLFFTLLLINIFFPLVVRADDLMSHFTNSSGFSTADSVGSIMSMVIGAFLSLLSLMFIVLILYAGFTWMTASGEEKKVEDAKSTIQRAVIGLIITIGAYVITYFVFSILPFGKADTSGSNDTGGTGILSGLHSFVNNLIQ